LQDRLQRVAINECYSSWQYINAGVPQGSRNLLFLLCINDIVDNIQSQVRLFADDTSIFFIVDNATLSNALLTSQKTIRNSFPSSKAFPILLVIPTNWLIAESPLVKPD
jgi:hypothetical protein